jgi:hypothetical protein
MVELEKNWITQHIRGPGNSGKETRSSSSKLQHFWYLFPVKLRDKAVIRSEGGT